MVGGVSNEKEGVQGKEEKEDALFLLDGRDM